MILSDVLMGAPFIYRENPDVRPRLFYRLYMHISGVTKQEFKYECYEVKDGCLQTPAVLFPADTIVEPYEFRKKSV